MNTSNYSNNHNSNHHNNNHNKLLYDKKHYNSTYNNNANYSYSDVSNWQDQYANSNKNFSTNSGQTMYNSSNFIPIDDEYEQLDSDMLPNPFANNHKMLPNPIISNNHFSYNERMASMKQLKENRNHISHNVRLNNIANPQMSLPDNIQKNNQNINDSINQNIALERKKEIDKQNSDYNRRLAYGHINVNGASPSGINDMIRRNAKKQEHYNNPSTANQSKQFNNTPNHNNSNQNIRNKQLSNNGNNSSNQINQNSNNNISINSNPNSNNYKQNISNQNSNNYKQNIPSQNSNNYKQNTPSQSSNNYKQNTPNQNIASNNNIPTKQSTQTMANKNVSTKQPNQQPNQATNKLKNNSSKKQPQKKPVQTKKTLIIAASFFVVVSLGAILAMIYKNNPSFIKGVFNKNKQTAINDKKSDDPNSSVLDSLSSNSNTSQTDTNQAFFNDLLTDMDGYESLESMNELTKNNPLINNVAKSSKKDNPLLSEKASLLTKDSSKLSNIERLNKLKMTSASVPCVDNNFASALIKDNKLSLAKSDAKPKNTLSQNTLGSSNDDKKKDDNKDNKKDTKNDKKNDSKNDTPKDSSTKKDTKSTPTATPTQKPSYSQPTQKPSYSTPKPSTNNTPTYSSSILCSGVSYNDGHYGWTVGGYNGGSCSSSYIGANSFNITVKKIGTLPWHVQMFQQDLNFKQGKEYRISFNITSSISRHIAVFVQETHGQWVSHTERTFSIPANQNTSICFNTSKITGDPKKFYIGLGKVSGDSSLPEHNVKITNVSICAKN